MRHHPDREQLTLVALGEQPVVDALAAHLDRCPGCRGEVTAMRDAVALGREAGFAPLETPPDHVWAGIAAELALDPVPPTGPAASARVSRRRRTVAAGALVAALAIIAAVVIATAGGPDGDATGPREVASTSLSVYAAGPPGAAGRVSVVATGDQRLLEVSTTIPPAPDRGYYEVWLLDEGTGDMIAIGVLGNNGQGTFTMPATVDMTRYSVVDVSAERYDGDPAHAASVLRGTLPS